MGGSGTTTASASVNSTGSGVSDNGNTEFDLGRGIIKTSRSREYTILLVGETGTGKTTFLSFLGNVLKGNGPNNYTFAHDHTNESGGRMNQSQTNSAKVYQFTSRNDITLRILDTPGFADTRGFDRDEQHKASIAGVIENSIPTVHAVIILANGTEARLGAATDYAMTTLTSIFPTTLAENIGIVFTHVASRLSSNFEQDSLPPILKGRDDKQFFLNNPLALWKKLVEFRNQNPTNRIDLEDHEDAVNASHTKALRHLVRLFDWLDGLVPQPTHDIIDLQKKSQEIEDSITSAMSYTSTLADTKKDLESRKKSNTGNVMKIDVYEKIMQQTQQVWEQVNSSTTNIICRNYECHSNCAVGVEKNKRWGLRIATALATLPFAPFHPVGYAAFNGAVGAAATRNPTRPNECPCGHTAENHAVGKSLWEERSTKVVLDPNAEKLYQKAKKNDESNSKIIFNLDGAIEQLNQNMTYEFARVAQLVRSYASLSLIGNFAAPKNKAISLLRLRLEAARKTGADQVLIDELEKSIETLTEKVDAVEKANNRAETRGNSRSG